MTKKRDSLTSCALPEAAGAALRQATAAPAASRAAIPHGGAPAATSSCRLGRSAAPAPRPTVSRAARRRPQRPKDAPGAVAGSYHRGDTNVSSRRYIRLITMIPSYHREDNSGRRLLRRFRRRAGGTVVRESARQGGKCFPRAARRSSRRYFGKNSSRMPNKRLEMYHFTRRFPIFAAH